MTETKTCRLCFNADKQLLNIFDEHDIADENIAEIISQHIGEVNKYSIFKIR